MDTKIIRDTFGFEIIGFAMVSKSSDKKEILNNYLECDSVFQYKNIVKGFFFFFI